jgi:hypothetical protein
MSIKTKSFLLKLFIFQILLTALLSIPMQAEAQVRVRRIPVPSSPLPPRVGQSGQVLEAKINQVARGRAIIQVKSLIQQQTGVLLRGPEIERIALAVRPLSHRVVQARLLVNEQIVTALKPVTSRAGRLVFGQHEIGVALSRQRVSTIKIEVIGEAVLDEVMVRTNGLTGVGPNLVIPVNRTLHGQTLSLASLLMTPQVLGPIRTLILEVSSSQRNAQLNIRSNNLHLASEHVSSLREMIVLTLPLGTSIHEILLSSLGSVTIHSVSLDEEVSFLGLDDQINWGL